MAQNKTENQIELEHSMLTEFTILYSKIKRLENRINLDKKEVNIYDIKEFNTCVRSLEKKFISYRKTLYPSKEEEH